MRRWPRRLVQLGALGFAFIVPALNYGGVLYQQYGKNAYHTVSLMGTFFDHLLFWLFSFAADLNSDPVESSISIVGGFGFFSFFGIQFLDPVVAFETLLRVPGAWAGLIAGSGLPLLIAALMGRIFCGWLCPINTVLEGVDSLRKRALPRLGIRSLDIVVPRWLKWVLFLSGVSFAVLADLAIWAHVLPHVQIGRDIFSLMVFSGATMGAWMFAAIIFAELFLSRRIWCRSICPTGALLGWVGAFAPVRIRKKEVPCLTECSACARICPMALAPAKPIHQSECMNCGLCVSACPVDLLSLLPSIVRENFLKEVSPVFRRIGVILVVVVGSHLLVSETSAHHMRGQPHYGYTENYPQTPTKETRAHIPGYDVTVVSYFFEGLRRERSDTPDDVVLYVSLANSRTHQSYTGPLSIEIWRDGKAVGNFEHDRPLEEAVYRVRHAVPGPGRYEIRLEAGAAQGSVEVDIEAEDASLTPYILGGLGLLVLSLFFLNRRRLRLGSRRSAHVAPSA